MLVLTRRPNEMIRVGKDIGIVVLEVRGNQVRIGVQAPKDVQIDREELYQRKLRSAQLRSVSK